MCVRVYMSVCVCVHVCYNCFYLNVLPPAHFPLTLLQEPLTKSLPLLPSLTPFLCPPPSISPSPLSLFSVISLCILPHPFPPLSPLSILLHPPLLPLSQQEAVPSTMLPLVTQTSEEEKKTKELDVSLISVHFVHRTTGQSSHSHCT